MGKLRSKVPLIVVVAPESCIVNRQCGVGDSKYVVTFDPLRPGHVKRRMRNMIFGHEHVLNNAYIIGG